MAHTNPETQDIIKSLTELVGLLKLREPASLSAPIQTDFLAIALATIRLLLDFSIYLFMTGMLVMGTIFLFSMGNEETLTKAKRTLNQSLIGLVMVFSTFAALQFFTDPKQKLVTALAGADIAIAFGTAFNLALLATSTGFIMVLLYSGVRFLFAGGNEESQAGAKKMMTAGLYGIILTLGSFAISRFLMTSFGALPQ